MMEKMIQEGFSCAILSARALTAVLVAFVAYFLLGSFWPDVGAVVAVAVMGAFILEGGNPDDDPKEGEDIPEDNLGS